MVSTAQDICRVTPPRYGMEVAEQKHKLSLVPTLAVAIKGHAQTRGCQATAMSSIQAEDSDSESEPQFSPANGSIRNEPLTYHSPQHQTILSAGSSGAGSPLREPLDPPPLSGREK